MRKRLFLKLITFITVLSLLVSIPVFAYATEGETPEIPVPPSVTEYTENFLQINKFLGLGEMPDLSKASVDFVFSDGSTQNVLLTNELIPEDFKTDTRGLVSLNFEINQTPFEIKFLVFDKECSISHFTDVSYTYWGRPHIRRGVSAGFFAGISQTEFGISGKLTRAELCQMLYNIYKNDKVMLPTVDILFADVADNMWYTEAVNACAQAGIVSGIGDDLFDPNGLVTRQDAAVMMMKILMGKDTLDALDYKNTVALAKVNGIPAVDINDTADYAKNAMAAALGVIYFGDGDGKVNPRSEITRTEVAAVLSNYFFAGYEEPREAPLIYLSPSNQIHNKYNGVDATEGYEMQAVAKVTEQVLSELGYRVFYADLDTPIKDETNKYGQEYKEDGITTRAEEAEALGAEAYVAIHSNAVGYTNNGKYQGTTVFYGGQNEGAKELSQFIYDRVAPLTPTKDKGIHDDIYESKVNGQTPYAEIWRPKMANLIIEVEYHDYKQYAKWITEHTKELGEAIAYGIDDYFNYKYAE